MLKKTGRRGAGSRKGRRAGTAGRILGTGIVVLCVLASPGASSGEVPYSPLWYTQPPAAAQPSATASVQAPPGIVGIDLTRAAAAPLEAHSPAAAPHSPTPRPARASAQWRRYISQLVQTEAQANHLEPALLYAVIRAESAYNPHAVSRKGAIGLMQVMPFTGRRFGVTDLSNPGENIKAGARYLGFLMRFFNNNRRLAVAAYNAGEQAVVRYGYRLPPFKETAAYVPRVLNYYRQYLHGAL
jgi:soluble lytic murein transglycosylase-like protein